MNWASEYFELAMVLCEHNPESEEEFETFACNGDEELQERFGIDGEQFEAICEALIPYADRDRSPLTGTEYRGFSQGDHWLAKVEA